MYCEFAVHNVMHQQCNATSLGFSSTFAVVHKRSTSNLPIRYICVINCIVYSVRTGLYYVKLRDIMAEYWIEYVVVSMKLTAIFLCIVATPKQPWLDTSAIV